MKRTARGLGLVLATALLLTPAAALAADPAPSAGKGPAVKPVKLESVEGSPLKRVILTEKAVQRLGIKAEAKVREEAIPHTQMAGGLVLTARAAMTMVEKGLNSILPTAAGASPVQLASLAPPADGLLVMVSLTPGELDRLAQDRPARLLSLTAGADASAAMTAVPSKLPPVYDPKRENVSLYYLVQGTGHGLTQGQRLRVELELSDHGARRSVVPISAVIHDGKGASFVVVNTAPQAYLRHPIVLERIAGDRAILTSAPPVGTTVVTVGAYLLYGAERLGK